MQQNTAASICPERGSGTRAGRRAARVVATSVVLLAVLFVTTACTTPKRSWQDWMEASASEESSQVASGPGQVESAAPLKPTVSGPVVFAKPYKAGESARAGDGFDLAMRNPDFPRSHIEVIHIDLTGPGRPVRLQWTGALAPQGPVGPWRSCPGRGKPGVDCNDVETSNTTDTFCTPKGVFPAAGFSDHLYLVQSCHYVTWVVHKPRYIAIHSHDDIPDQPSSSGCIRVPYEAAKLIHNNSIAGTTLIHISGTWKPPSN